MPKRRSCQLLMLALMGSLAAHAAILVLADVVIARKHRASLLAKPQVEPPVLPVELVLGVDQPLPQSPTWLGYVEPEEHAAPPSETEQGAFTDQPIVPAMTPRQAIERAMRARQEAAQSARQLLQTLARALASGSDDLPEPTMQPPPQPSEELKAEAESEAQPAATDVPVAAAPPTEEAGALSDKQSPPASVIDIPPDQWKLGKPLVGQGLELKPHRPTFTLLTLMTAAPGNPLCEINFDASGVPRTASILETSGDPRVDNAILASLYRWRASGSDLEQLSSAETLPVQMRILLSRRRAA
ncbi:MAG: hypothetical protein L0Y44_11300 [Phycisphaerales bacterium]|nr:hypothetical protein [Phycisphaerales bacterium]MCI0631225.1 hypothetical protein [Phycisphaerales bacterium]